MSILKSVLLVEDDMIDAMAVERAFKELNIRKALVHVKNGEEAIEYLKNNIHNMPGFILLDLNMPKMGGIEFMKIAKADEGMKKIPIIVLTTSEADQDRVETFGLGVAGYIIKPVIRENLTKTVKTIDEYWALSKFPDDY